MIAKVFTAILLLVDTVSTYAETIDKNGFEHVSPIDYREIRRKAQLAYAGKRYEEAFPLFQRAACAGDKESQSAVGRMYLVGQGTTRDDLIGYGWLKVAAEVIYPGYQTIVKQLYGAMTPEQRAIADAEAAKRIAHYGMAATNMSCNANASRGGYVIDEMHCTPRQEGGQVLLRLCVDEPVAH